MKRITFRYIFLFVSLVLASIVDAKSPHGVDFKINCATCHTTEDWTKTNTSSFNHSTTGYPLTGQHRLTDCIKCHADLEFRKNQPKDCSACHTDVHQQTVGKDCERCHTSSSWNVNNIVQVHNQSRFPLLGLHRSVDCYQCHSSGSRLRFDPMRSECVDCHLKDYNSTTAPSHVNANFPKDCDRCHSEKGWQTARFNHDATSFPLSGAHSGLDCTKCHSGANSPSPECRSCHLNDYNETTNPSHLGAKFSTDCSSCHKTTSWSPAPLFNHTPYFRISSGGHLGQRCSSCHTNSANYTVFTCVTSACHADAHNQEQGSAGCYSCHAKD